MTMSLPSTMAIHQNYINFHTEDSLNIFQFVASDQYKVNCVQKYDRLLQQTLLGIFREHDCTTNERIKQFIRAPGHTDQESVVKLILKKKPELGERFPKGELQDLPLLWITVLFSCHNSAELLVRSGADVNEPFGHPQQYAIDERSSLLHVLLLMFPSSWNERLIHLITEHGADLQARDSCGRTPLHYAVKSGRIEVAQMFLEKGAKVNAAEDNGMTPLLTAASTSEAGQMLPLLMKYGADATVKDALGYNVLHWLTSNPQGEHVDLARILIENGASLGDSDYFLQYQPIHAAVQMGYNDLLNLYLDHGAKINVESNYREFPLTLTMDNQRKHQAVLETLLDRGADANVRTTRERTALHMACENAKYFQGVHEQIKLLLSAGADVLAEDSDGNTPFALMQGDNVNGGCRESIQLMLKALALKRVQCQPTIEFKDERIINGDPKLWNYYQVCVMYADKMKNTKFIKTCTFFQLLTECRCEIAELMRNRGFEACFRMYDLSDAFFTYADDLLEAFERARKLYRTMLEQEDVISEAVYDILPYIVVRKIARYTVHDCVGIVK